MNATGLFWAKVDTSGDCWIWTGARLKDEYGDYGNAWWNGRAQPAHRVSYQLERGPIPVGLQIDHLCRTRLCVRPDHLEPVTCRENVLRGQGAGAMAVRRDMCLQGLHELTPVAGGRTAADRHRRRCRPCAAASSRRYRARKAAA